MTDHRSTLTLTEQDLRDLDHVLTRGVVQGHADIACAHAEVDEIRARNSIQRYVALRHVISSALLRLEPSQGQIHLLTTDDLRRDEYGEPS